MNLNQIDAIRLAKSLGCTIRMSRHGDYLYSHATKLLFTAKGSNG